MSVLRLATQNLLLSAAEAVSGHPTGASVRDLSTLINVLALHEGVLVLGNDWTWEQYARNFPLIQSLVKSGLLHIAKIEGADVPRIVEVAQQHLAIAIGEKDLVRFEPLIREAHLSRMAFTGDYYPDSHSDLEAGREWLRTVPRNCDFTSLPDAHIERSILFFVRTFFYLAYMDLFDVDFATDRARYGLMDEVSRREMSFQDELLSGLRNAMALNLSQARTPLPPFALAVFQRCKGDRSRIVDEIQNLRKQLEQSRERLLTLEEQFRFGPMKTSDPISLFSNETSMRESQKARREFVAVLKELTRAYGINPQRLESRELLAVASATAELGVGLTNPAVWLKMVAALPSDKIHRLLIRRRFAEIHRLFLDLSGPDAIRRSLEALFGQYVMQSFTGHQPEGQSRKRA